MSGLRVERTLGLAQLQDGGRFGTRHIGVTQGGALDWVAAAWANRLLGNTAGCAVLEIPFGGLTLLCQQHSTLAITGADLQATLDGQAVANWQSFTVRPGQQLTFATPASQPRSGARGYLAAPGGMDAPQVLGSRSTVRRDQLGGLRGNGEALRAGDLLAIGSATPAPAQVPGPHRLTTKSTASLDLIMGSQSALFSGRSLFAVFNEPWQVGQRADRMGVRLCGPAVHYQGQPMISEGIPLGAVQVPPDGQPIILLNDRQTIGGYPRLGALTPASVARLAQHAPGDTLWLRPVPLERALREQRDILDALANAPLVRLS